MGEINVRPPSSTSSWVPIVAHIRENATGKIRTYSIDGVLEDGAEFVSTFIWEHGNYSCDCNRELFFGYANDEDEKDVVCGDYRYSVNLEDPKTGAVFYREYY